MKLQALFLAVSLAGCARTIQAKDYDASCDVPADCVVIFVGDVCACSCDVAAISATDYQKYLDDRGNQSCNVDCGACPDVDTVCTAGVCGIAP